jgi:hypothetical protein
VASPVRGRDNRSVRVPILVRCECGRTTEAEAGAEVACGCGRRYATDLSAEQRAALHSLGQQLRVFARLGVGVVGLLAMAGFLFVGPGTGLAALGIGVVLWWFVVQPVWRRRAVARLAGLPPAPVRPQ